MTPILPLLASLSCMRQEALESARVPSDASAFHLFLLMGQSTMQGKGAPYPGSYGL